MGGRRIVTWNVNSIRARLEQLLDWLEEHRPDVALLQETKIGDQEFPVDEIGDVGYDAVFTGHRSYNGVAILSRDEMRKVIKGLPDIGGDAAHRFISAEIEGVRYSSVYVPNGQSVGSEIYRYKLEFLARLGEVLGELGAPDAALLVSGDFNIAPADIDVWDPAAMVGSTHVTREEREALAAITARGFSDLFRARHPDLREFSWWDYRAGSLQKNMGLRIDLHLGTASIAARVDKVWIDIGARRREKASDHAPVMVELS
jgi:exodeoxyribonuclease-3